MTEIRNILVPTDFSEPSRSATECAARIASERGARLHVFHANLIHTADESDRLEDFAARVRERHPELDIEASAVRSIDAPEGILRAASEADADVIVIGAKERGSVSRFLFGSTCRQVVRKSDASVLILRDIEPARPSETKSIALALDLGPGSEELLREAYALARSLSADLEVVHVVEPTQQVVTQALPESMAQVAAPDTGQALQSVQELLDQVVASEEVGDMTVTARCLQGFVAETLSHYLNRVKPDLLLLGTHGRTGVQRVLLGSVAEQMAVDTPQPIMVLKTETSDAEATTH